MGAETRPPRASWTLAAWSLLGIEIAAGGFLAARPPGPAPVWVYDHMGEILFPAALAVLGWAVVARARGRAGRSGPGGFLALALVLATSTYPFPFPARREGDPSRVAIELPVEGRWIVRWGGPDSRRNLLARTRADRRFGYVLVPAEPGESGIVRAPCPGLVVRAVDGLPDAPATREPGVPEAGNHVVLEVAPGEFLVLASLRQGSLRVRAGDRVERGDELGQVGASARELFAQGPRLEIHLQDSPAPRAAQGVPFWFHDYLENGERRSRGMPRGASLSAADRAPSDRIARAP